VHETAEELLHGQNALFPPLINCNHPLEFILAKLTKCEDREEVRHSNIRTIGKLCGLDTASVDRLPIINRKILHVMAVMEYKKLMEVQVESDVT
jgi:hypothetical protein